MRHLSLFLFVFILSGCAASGPKYSDFVSSIPKLEEGKARVFLLRPSFLVGSAQSPEIEISDKQSKRKVGTLPNSSFGFFDVDPGYVTITSVRSGLLALEEKKFAHGQYFDPNEEYYLRVSLGIPLANPYTNTIWVSQFGKEAFEIRLITDVQLAKQELQSLSYHKFEVQK